MYRLAGHVYTHKRPTAGFLALYFVFSDGEAVRVEPMTPMFESAWI